MTDESCVNYCNSKGYSFAGVEYARECYCGYGLASSSISYASDCTMACTGDSTEPCGAGDRLSVFTNGGKGPQTNPVPAGWSSMGCYSDSVSSRSLSNGVAHDQSAQMTVELCTNACQSAGYSLAGVEYAGECYCDDSLQGGHLVSGDRINSGCNMACNGDSSEYCGGPDRLNLYTATSNAPPSTTTTTSSPTTTSSTTATSTSTTTTTTSSTPAPTNYVNNTGFEQGSSSWSFTTNGNVAQSALTGGYGTGTSAHSGSGYAYISEGTYGDTGTRSFCFSTYVDVPAGTFNLQFYIGRSAAPPPGSSVSTDSISYSVYFAGNTLTNSGSVCNPTQGGCSAKSVGGGSNLVGYNLASFTVTNPTDAYQQLLICPVYTTPRRGSEDTTLLDDVSLIQTA